MCFRCYSDHLDDYSTIIPGSSITMIAVEVTCNLCTKRGQHTHGVNTHRTIACVWIIHITNEFTLRVHRHYEFTLRVHITNELLSRPKDQPLRSSWRKATRSLQSSPTLHVGHNFTLNRNRIHYINYYAQLTLVQVRVPSQPVRRQKSDKEDRYLRKTTPVAISVQESLNSWNKLRYLV